MMGIDKLECHVSPTSLWTCLAATVFTYFRYENQQIALLYIYDTMRTRTPTSLNSSTFVVAVWGIKSQKSLATPCPWHCKWQKTNNKRNETCYKICQSRKRTTRPNLPRQQFLQRPPCKSRSSAWNSIRTSKMHNGIAIEGRARLLVGLHRECQTRGKKGKKERKKERKKGKIDMRSNILRKDIDNTSSQPFVAYATNPFFCDRNVSRPGVLPI